MDVALFDLASRRMDWLGQDQRVVAENIANADTPGFKARVIEDFASVLADAGPGGMAVTDAAHIPGLGGPQGARVSEDPASWGTTLDGNTVVLEQQSIRSAQIGGAYALAASLYKKGHDFVRLAAAGNV